MFEAGDALIYPQFATHNAHTIAAIHHFARGRPFEFQRLHGMGADLYAEVIGKNHLNVPCRVYAPVGSHEDLLPYLVRRLLENGANTSFVNRIVDEDVPIRELVADPLEMVRHLASIPHPRIPPADRDLFAQTRDFRKNSMGVNLANDNELNALADSVNAAHKPVERGTARARRQERGRISRRHRPGRSPPGRSASRAAPTPRPSTRRWPTPSPRNRPGTPCRPPAGPRSSNTPPICSNSGAPSSSRSACAKPARRCPAAIAEVREAADFCRYYAAMARKLFAHPEDMPGPTGESNELYLHGRGVFVCISPWNFPLAIFIGQVAAGLAAGNSVIAKPADQTTLVGYAAVKLLHEAGVPTDVLQFVPCKGSVLGKSLLTRPDVAGVCFTGSTETAWTINRTLAARDALDRRTDRRNRRPERADRRLLCAARTTGQGRLASAFDSAGQRCSAARVLFVQDDIADKVIAMLTGAMDELVIGDPGLLSTDVGPVIDEASHKNLERSRRAHGPRSEADQHRRSAKAARTARSSRHAPTRSRRSSCCTQEVFGPVLHVVRWKADELDDVIDAINATGLRADPRHPQPHR